MENKGYVYGANTAKVAPWDHQDMLTAETGKGESS